MAGPELRLPVTFDSWYTQPAFCRFLDKELQLAYVGTLAADEQVQLASGEKRLEEFAKQLKQEHERAIEAGKEPVLKSASANGAKESYYSYCRTHRIANFGRLRLVINHRSPDLADSPFTSPTA